MMNSAPNAAPRKALGRGLAALIPGAGETLPSPVGLRQLAIERIKPNRAQPRKQFDEAALEELAASIRERGVLQPIVVRRRGEGYEIVAGERRWRAAAKAGLTEIPALVKELTDSDALQVALIENIQREDLDPLEEAESYHRLTHEHGLTQEQVALAVGKSRVTVANSVRLLKLSEPLLTMLADGRLTAGHARALMMLGTDGAMRKLADEIVARHLNVRDAERRARELAPARKKTEATPAASPAERQVEERLQRALGTKVRVHQREGKGHLEIHFHSLDALDTLLERLAP
ncbi:MAG: ParB/RepB/Spo0J family partition protein [Myxococcota bacterium]